MQGYEGDDQGEVRARDADVKLPTVEPLRLSREQLDDLLKWMSGRARIALANVPAEFTLQTTALVNEAVIKMLKSFPRERVEDRAYLYGAAAGAVREALANAARHRMTLKNGVKLSGVVLTAEMCATVNVDLSELHEAIERLTEREPRAARVVDLKFYGGLTKSEIAELLGVSTSTVDADWKRARQMLFRMLK